MFLTHTAATMTSPFKFQSCTSASKHHSDPVLQQQQAFHVVQTGDTAHPSNLYDRASL